MDKIYVLLLVGLVLLTGSTAIAKLIAKSTPPPNTESQIISTNTPTLTLIPEASPSTSISNPISSTPTVRPRREKKENDDQGEVDGLSITLSKNFSAKDLLPFDGTNPNLPIYIGLNGLVYDVSSGRDYYEIGGPYHFLAGRDSSAELNLIGGNLISKKYPVIGRLEN